MLGHGRMDDLRDIVVVDSHRFGAARSQEIAAEIGRLNAELDAEGRPYLLICVGRLGSSEPTLGVPVTWNQIAGARVIVEAGFHDFKVTPSQGTHFFQNLMTAGVGYFTVNPEVGEGFLDWEWLAAQRARQRALGRAARQAVGTRRDHDERDGASRRDCEAGGRVSRCLLAVVVATVAAASQVVADPTPDQVYLAAERLIAERAYPPEPVKAGLQTPDELVLYAARRSSRPAVRVAAVRALARFEDPSDIGRLAQHIADPNEDVRTEVVKGLAFVLRRAKPVEDARTIALVFDLLRARLLMEQEPGVREAILASLGELNLAGQQAVEAERILFERIKFIPASIGAVRGIEAWYRRQASRPVLGRDAWRLRQLSVPRLGAEAANRFCRA